MTTRAGPKAAAWASSSSTERWAASAWTRKRAGSVRMTSSAWVPTDPVEPIRLTVRTRVSSPEVHRLDHEVRGGHDEEQPVDPVEDAAVAGQQPPHVLEPQVPLDHGLAQVAQRRHDRHHHAVEGGLAQRPGIDEGDDDDRDEDGHHGTTDEALPTLVGADGGS